MEVQLPAGRNTYLANRFAVQCIEINIMDPLRQFVRL